MSQQLSDDLKEKYIANVPLRRAGTPAEVAGVVLPGIRGC